MPTKFALNDTVEFDSNIKTYGAVLAELDAKLGPALAQKLKGDLDRGETLDALLAALAPSANKK
jgi:hypothetical protein